MGNGSKVDPSEMRRWGCAVVTAGGNFDELNSVEFTICLEVAGGGGGGY